jgi:hypothetical protein
MDLKERLVLCKQCQKKGFDPTLGVICSLSNAKPNFESNCSDFVIDPKEAQRMAAKTENIEEEKSKNYTIWVVIGVILIILRIILRMAR